MSVEVWLVIAFSLISGTVLFGFPFFHLVSEGAAIVSVFLLFFHVVRDEYLLKTGFFTISAGGLLSLTPIVLLHILTYKGMTLWDLANINQATQYWIISKYSEVLILFSAMVFAHNKVPIKLVLILGLIGSLLLIYLVSTGRFLDAYVEGTGLTAFKIYSEYAVIGVFLLGLTITQISGGFLPLKLHYRMLMVMTCLMLSGFMFTLYQDVHGILNTIGHLFKVAGYAALLAMVFQARQDQSLVPSR